MKLGRCPICHSHIHLDALIQDESGQALLALVAKLPDFVAKPLVSYLALFRPAKQDLTNSRALKIAQQVLDEYRADHILAAALTETVSKIREKRVQYHDTKPLTNHNYLKQVYQTAANKLGGSVSHSSSSSSKPNGDAQHVVKQDNTDWYFEQAERILKTGQDPLQSTIGDKLRELNWRHPNEI